MSPLISFTLIIVIAQLCKFTSKQIMHAALLMCLITLYVLFYYFTVFFYSQFKTHD